MPTKLAHHYCPTLLEVAPNIMAIIDIGVLVLLALAPTPNLLLLPEMRTALLVTVIFLVLVREQRLGQWLHLAALRAIVVSHIARFVVLAVLVLALGPLTANAVGFPVLSVVFWLLSGFCSGLILRLLLVSLVQLCERRGHLTDRAIIIGAPHDTKRLMQRLRDLEPVTIRVLNLFAPDAIDEVIQFGQKNHLDWIFVARPAQEIDGEEAWLERLKSLSAPIALLPMDDDIEPISVDNLDLDGFTPIAKKFGQERFGYVVTPNADHLVRFSEDPSYRKIYAAADYVLLDSRFIALWQRLVGSSLLRVCPGSDLTAQLFSEVIRSEDRIVLIGGTTDQATYLRGRYGLRDVRQHIPPMGFIRDMAALEECLEFIETYSPFRFCLLAVGAPQQEIVAAKLKERGKSQGLALCIGASINFITKTEARAPLWMQRIGAEWAYRLCRNPKRLANRYLVRGPRVFSALRRHPLVVKP